jgi:hypothetical protein
MIEFSAETLASARRAEVEADPTAENVWWVKSLNRDKRYRVQTDYNPATNKVSWVTCTCPHGMHAGPDQTRCYHVGAVLMEILARRSGR